MGAYTAEERRRIQEAIEYLQSVKGKKKELRGGAFPLLALLFGLIGTAARVLPRALGRVAATGARGLTRVVRAAPTATGRSAARPPILGKTQGRLLGLAGLGAGAGGIVELPEEPFRDVPVERYRETVMPTGWVGDINVDEDIEGDANQPFNITPVRYHPTLRNVYSVGRSRNPLQTGQYSSLLLAPRTKAATTQRSSRDISRLIGLGKQTYRKRVLKTYGLEDKSYSLAELAKITGVPKKTLQEVYNRGSGAYDTNPTSVRMKGSFKKNVDAPMSQKLSKEQWSMARVYSFLAGNKKHDNDLRQ